MTRHITATRSTLVLLLLCAAVAAMACSNRSRDSLLSKTGMNDTTRGADGEGAQRFSDRELPDLLLPRGAVPAGLAPSDPFLIPNEIVAQMLPDAEAGRRAMEKYGRVQGAAMEYELPGQPRATEPAVAVISAVSWYSTVAGAQTVIEDPTMELALHGLGLTSGELKTERVGQQTRMFRGFRDGDDPDRAAYIVLFRRQNTIGTVVVVVPATSDDGGKLATTLAKKQAQLSLSSALR
jgi:hypothetical protein